MIYAVMAKEMKKNIKNFFYVLKTYFLFNGQEQSSIVFKKKDINKHEIMAWLNKLNAESYLLEFTSNISDKICVDKISYDDYILLKNDYLKRNLELELNIMDNDQ